MEEIHWVSPIITNFTGILSFKLVNQLNFVFNDSFGFGNNLSYFCAAVFILRFVEPKC